MYQVGSVGSSVPAHPRCCYDSMDSNHYVLLSCHPVILLIVLSCSLVHHDFLSSCLPAFLSSCLPVVLISCRPAFLPSCLPAVLPCCRPAFLPSCLPAVLPSCRPVFLLSCLPVVLPVLPSSQPPVPQSSLPPVLLSSRPPILPFCFVLHKRKIVQISEGVGKGAFKLL